MADFKYENKLSDSKESIPQKVADYFQQDI